MDPDPKREAERIRKAQQRTKNRLIADGTYVPTALELAKQLLETMDEPDVAAAYSDEKIGPLLQQDDKKTLHNFAYYLKTRRRKDYEEEAKRIDQEQIISEKGRMFVNQKTYDLHEALLMPMNEEERISLVKATIDSNLFLFLEYMEGHQLPSNDFLKIVVTLKNQLEPSSFTELFVRVCTYQKIEDLKVSTDMVWTAIMFLVEKKRDDKAAYGLLRLIYLNNITLSGFQKTMLIKFQEDYQQTILRFFKSITPLETQVAESLPACAFCFTTPILQALRNEGKVFFTQIPYQFMPFLIQIVCYSFTESSTSFHNFLDVFKEGMRQHFNTLVQNRFTDLLQRILDETITMRPIFFCTLDYSATVLERAFFLLKQRQIVEFNQQVVHNLINGDHETLKQMSSGPRIIPQNSQMKLKPLLKELRALNPYLNSDLLDLDLELNDEAKNYFQAVGIQVPLPLQVLCFNFCTSSKFQGKWLIQLDTGTGKTALCFKVACFYASQGHKVLVINISEELTFRDYKKSLLKSQTLGIPVSFIETFQPDFQINEGISFLSFQNFAMISQTLTIDAIKNLAILADEFDQIIFGESDLSLKVSKCLSSARIFIGLSGSDLKDYHTKAIEQTIAGKSVKMNINDVFKPSAVNFGIDVYTKISEYRQVLETYCAQQALKTPVIVIADDDKLILTKKLKNIGVPVEALFQTSFLHSNGLLTVFTKKQAGKYPVFIINDAQGRGLDFPSSTEIEDAGGVFLIIAKLPNSFLQFKQFLGRTGRMGNKAQYCVVLHDSEAKNEEGETYLEKKLQILQNYDLQRASKLGQAQVYLKDESKQPPLQIEPSLLQGERENSAGIGEHDQRQVSSINQICAADQREEEQAEQVITKTDQSLCSSNSLLDKEEQKNEWRFIRKRDSKNMSKMQESGIAESNNAVNKKHLIDDGYFSGYSKIDIHNEMCADKRRVDAYEAALKSSCAGKLTIDVGAGTGILSFMAAEAGASRVYAIEKAGIFSKLKKEVSKRKLTDKVKIMNCLAEEAPLDDIIADVIVSEWMGSFLLSERMLPSVLAVRDKSISPCGFLIPCTARIIIAAALLTNIEKVMIHGHQKDVIGLDASTKTVPADQITSSQAQILELQLSQTPSGFDSFESEFELLLSKQTSINAIVGWFEVEMIKDQWLSTSPFEEPTHWEQTVFAVMDTEVLAEGALVSGKVSCKPMTINHRGLDVLFSFSNLTEDHLLQYNYFVQ